MVAIITQTYKIKRLITKVKPTIELPLWVLVSVPNRLGRTSSKGEDIFA